MISGTDNNGSLGGSDSNQQALEARFQELYIKMMEKKLEFKEAIEPYKADNENSSKG